MSGPMHTPGPWAVGAQNDALFITAGRAPALSNDYPWHDAPRVALAKVFGPTEGDCLPVNAKANARLFAVAPELLEDGDALLIAFAEGVNWTPEKREAYDRLSRTIAKARGET